MVFADGFAGAYKDPGRAAFRPTGLAEGADGALYVSDDVHGRIWRITYNGDGTDKVAPASAPTVATTAPGLAMPPEGTHPEAGRSTAALPTPPGATLGQVALGDRIFHGEASDGACSGCHGSNAGGSTVGPALDSGHWLWSDGGLSGLTATIESGVAHPEQYQGVVPPLGSAPLSSVGRGRGGGICLGRRPCRKAMSPPMIARLLFSLQTTARSQRSGAGALGIVRSAEGRGSTRSSATDTAKTAIPPSAKAAPRKPVEDHP